MAVVLEIGYESDKLKPVYHISIKSCLDLKTDKNRSKLKHKTWGRGAKFVEMWVYNFFICSSASWYSLEIFVLISENDRCQGSCMMHIQKSFGQEVILLGCVSQ